MRLFLAYFLFDMFSRSLIMLTPAEDDWIDELGMKTKPMALPSREELKQIDEGSHPDSYTSRADRWRASGKSAARYFLPYPTDNTLDKMRAADGLERVGMVGKYAMVWLSSRMGFVGRMVGVDQDWPMFSPNVGRDDTVARLKLIYDDGSEVEHRLVCDPVDLTAYSHWFEEKRLQTACKVHRDYDTRLGYCHMVAHHYARHENGAKLVRILVFKCTYNYPSANDDEQEWLAEQTGPPPSQIDPPFWEYDVATRTGRRLR